MKEKYSIMEGGKWRLLLALLGMSLLLFGVWRIFFQNAPRPPLPELLPNLPTYTIHATIDNEKQALSVTQETHYVNTTGQPLNQLIFRTYANAYVQEGLPENLTLYGTFIDGEHVKTAYLDKGKTALSVPLVPLANGESVTLKMTYLLHVPTASFPFGKTAEGWQILHAFPMLSVFQNGAWDISPYTPQFPSPYTAFSNWEVYLNGLEGKTLVGGMPFSIKEGTHFGRLVGAQDFSFLLKDSATTKQTTQGNSLIKATGKDAKMVNATLKKAKEILAVYQKLYGDYPFQSLHISFSTMEMDHLVAPGMVVLRDTFSLESSSFELALARAMSQQWFFMKVANDPLRSRWLPEGLSTWAMLCYVKEKYGQEALEHQKMLRLYEPMQEYIPGGLTPSTHVDQFHDLSSYDAIMKGRGGALFDALNLLTQGQLHAFLQHYIHDYAHKVIDVNTFEDALCAFTGVDAKGLIRDYITGTIY